MRIRKEIRNLSHQEWDEVVKAMWVMKTITQKEGERKYGLQFKTYDRMLAKHANAALNPNGDQAHFGPIFGVFHRAWLLEFENSLIAINKNITGLPYWNCTVDANLQDKHMSIFSSTYLGSSRGDPKDNYIVKNGRFAFWPIAIATSLYNISSNIYGLMRHPLSINSAPYVTRRSGQLCGQITNLPSIQDWNGCLRDTNKYDINSWDSCVEKNIHAPPHLYLSGSWLTSSQKKRLFLNQSASVEINSINCVQWLGYIPAPPQINLTAIPSRTFIHPYAAKCFNCSNDIENNSIHMCEPANVERLCGPLFSDFIEYLNDQTKISTQSSTDNTPLVSDDYYTYNDDGISESTTLSTASPKLTKQSFQVTLIKQENLQILGDFGDPAFSPNDPMFAFHHANIDRHLSTWLLSHNTNQTIDELRYFKFPTAGYAEGCNLDDIISTTDPFLNLFDSISENLSVESEVSDDLYTYTIPVDDLFLKSHNLSRYPSVSPNFACNEYKSTKYSAGPYTVKEMISYTFALRFKDQLYTYDSIQNHN